MAIAKPHVMSLLGAAAAAFLLLPALASSNPQDERSKPAKGPSEKIVEADREKLYQEGISLEKLMDAGVVDAQGNDVGEVADFVVGGKDNRIVGMVVETGGFLNIGDRHLLYPFDQASIRGSDRIQAEIRAATARELSLFNEIEGENLQGDRWRASQLIGGLAYSDGEPYGRVDDVIIDKTGNIMAVVVQPDVMYEDDAYYAWPYVTTYDVEEGIYDVPMDQRHAFGMEPLDRSKLRGAENLTAAASRE